MREKNIKRAARALYLSQGDDKNELLSKRIQDEEASKLVKDQGRALVVLEHLCLPSGTWDYSEYEMADLLRAKLENKGHRIQADDEPDTEQYAEEKRIARERRTARVPDVFGMKLDPIESKKEEHMCDCHNHLHQVCDVCQKTPAEKVEAVAREAGLVPNKEQNLTADSEEELEALIRGIRLGWGAAMSSELRK